MKNNLVDLNNHLFAQLERLGDESLKPEEVAVEIERGKAISAVAKDVVELGKLALAAEKAKAEGVGSGSGTLLEGPKSEV